MKLGFLEIGLNPPFPVHRMLKEETHMGIADDLHCRVLYLGLGTGRPFVHISIDAVEIYRFFQDRMQEKVEEVLGEKVNFVAGATHTHNAPCITTDGAYRDYIIERIGEELPSLAVQDYPELSYEYRYAYFDAVGKSRVPNQGSDSIYAEVLSFYSEGIRLGSLLMYNSHPTIKKLWEDDFTSEYPGYAIRELKRNHPGEFFTFALGPAGDISSRDVRKNQTYGEMERLSQVLVDKYEELLRGPHKPKLIDAPAFHESVFSIQHIRRTPENITLPENPTKEELGVLEHFSKRKKKTGLDAQLPPSCQVAHLILSEDYSVIFEPFELYSEFYHAVDKEHCSLVTVSNGFGHYVCDLRPQHIAHEVFDDTWTDSTKRRFVELLGSLSRQEDCLLEKGETDDQSDTCR